MQDCLVIEKSNLQARAYTVLRKALMAGRFQPGQKMLLRPLASELGISITPVREALLQLVSESALTSDGSRSISVPSISLERFMEIRELRLELEGRAATAAALHAVRVDLKELETLQRQLIAYRRSGAFQQAMTTNENFHFAVYRLARMPVLYRLIEGLWVQIGPIFTRLYDQVGPNVANMGHPHDELIRALRHRDGVAARHAIAADILWASRHLEATLAPDLAAEA